MKRKSQSGPIKILSPFQITESALGSIKKMEGFTVDLLSPDKIGSITELIDKYDALIVSDSMTIDEKIISAGKRLETICLVGTELDNIDLDYATSRGILVMNTPLANTVTTAEHTISMLMALSRNIPQATASMKVGKWEKKRFTGTEVLNKVLGVVGLGRIGRMVADRARGFGMRILVNDPLITEEIALRSGGELVDMDRLLSESDYITIHTPKMKRDKVLFTRELFSKMKPGVRIINLTGGGVLSEDDLLWAIDEGIVAGAALDVFETEPPDNKRLLENEKVILTPHLGGDTEEAYEKTSRSLSEQIIEYYRSGIVQNPVNFPALGQETLKTLKPFMDLGQKLGSFMGQILTSEKIKRVEIGYLGKIEEYETSLISLNILRGLLSFITQEKINLINAPVMAREYGIEVEEDTSSSSRDYSSEITVSVSGENWKRFISGAIVGNRPRIVRVDNYFIETIPEGIIILVVNDDNPGVVGSIGTSLGFAQVNIGRMQLARDIEKKKNLILISADSPVEDTILDLLRKLPNVNEVRQIEL
ncbi:MAG: phosphoglycerate dehydrogenase [Deltaproteobacteria bacterium]|uniref:D-3-phosphoglycerate dehydrogenase n=1 Tax=Candidatus Zymogenus saltonus TaxID=2844893 RepID=A0A9D8PM86_9DELT|nr:phosphoglycerate dehydrogenase [Candidatus Zymogenus saltonus]